MTPDEQGEEAGLDICRGRLMYIPLWCCRDWYWSRRRCWKYLAEEPRKEPLDPLVCGGPQRLLTIISSIVSRRGRHQRTGRAHDQDHILQRFRYSFVLYGKACQSIQATARACTNVPVGLCGPHASNDLTSPALESTEHGRRRSGRRALPDA